MPGHMVIAGGMMYTVHETSLTPTTPSGDYSDTDCLLLQDDNFSLSLLNELSVKYGIQTHLSHAPLPQKLEELREYLRREIKKELKVRESRR